MPAGRAACWRIARAATAKTTAQTTSTTPIRRETPLGQPNAAGHDRAAKHGERLAERAEPVDAERGALPGRRRPSRDERGADRKGRAGEAEEERRRQQRAIAVVSGTSHAAIAGRRPAGR